MKIHTKINSAIIRIWFHGYKYWQNLIFDHIDISYITKSNKVQYVGFKFNKFAIRKIKKFKFLWKILPAGRD